MTDDLDNFEKKRLQKDFKDDSELGKKSEQKTASLSQDWVNHIGKGILWNWKVYSLADTCVILDSLKALYIPVKNILVQELVFRL